MEIKKEVTIVPMTTDGKELKVGDKVVFNAEERCFAGKFIGISKKGAVMFEGVIAGCTVKFNIMSKSITCIYRADVSVESEAAG